MKRQFLFLKSVYLAVTFKFSDAELEKKKEREREREKDKQQLKTKIYHIMYPNRSR